MITVYTIAYNEEILLPFFINWYRTRFPNCKIIVHDNYSIDNTEKIALENGCEIIKYDSNNEIRDDIYLNIKNNCWKQSNTDWVVVCDVDELIDINEVDILYENSSIIKFNAFNMVSMNDELNLNNIIHGVRDEGYDKFYMFNKTMIKEINYYPGCHKANPVGIVSFSEKIYNAYHFKYINLQYLIDRYKLFKSRLSKINKNKGWGFQYSQSETSIIENFQHMKTHKHLKKLL